MPSAVSIRRRIASERGLSKRHGLDAIASAAAIIQSSAMRRSRAGHALRHALKWVAVKKIIYALRADQSSSKNNLYGIRGNGAPRGKGSQILESLNIRTMGDFHLELIAPK